MLALLSLLQGSGRRGGVYYAARTTLGPTPTLGLSVSLFDLLDVRWFSPRFDTVFLGLTAARDIGYILVSDSPAVQRDGDLSECSRQSVRGSSSTHEP